MIMISQMTACAPREREWMGSRAEAWCYPESTVWDARVVERGGGKCGKVVSQVSRGNRVRGYQQQETVIRKKSIEGGERCDREERRRLVLPRSTVRGEHVDRTSARGEA